MLKPPPRSPARRPPSPAEPLRHEVNLAAGVDFDERAACRQKNIARAIHLDVRRRDRRVGGGYPVGERLVTSAGYGIDDPGRVHLANATVPFIENVDVLLRVRGHRNLRRDFGVGRESTVARESGHSVARERRDGSGGLSLESGPRIQ
jgi:hypothetical protein